MNRNRYCIAFVMIGLLGCGHHAGGGDAGISGDDGGTCVSAPVSQVSLNQTCESYFGATGCASAAAQVFIDPSSTYRLSLSEKTIEVFSSTCALPSDICDLGITFEADEHDTPPPGGFETLIRIELSSLTQHEAGKTYNLEAAERFHPYLVSQGYAQQTSGFSESIMFQDASSSPSPPASGSLTPLAIAPGDSSVAAIAFEVRLQNGQFFKGAIKGTRMITTGTGCTASLTGTE